MSHFERFVTDGNAKAGVILDEGFMAETRAKTVEQERERERRSVRSLAESSQLSLFGGGMERWRRT